MKCSGAFAVVRWPHFGNIKEIELFPLIVVSVSIIRLADLYTAGMELTEVKAIKMDHVRLGIEIQVDSGSDFKQFYFSGLERMKRRKGC